MEFSIATINDKESILDYYIELDSESSKISRLKTCDSQIIEEWMNDATINLYLLYDEKRLLSVIKAKRGIGDESHSSWLNISSRQNERNKGYAKSLIKYAENILKENKVKIIRTQIFSWNKPAIAMIEKAGFTLSGRIVMSHYDDDICDYIDDLLYHKFL